jgi:hypothetical protein
MPCLIRPCVNDWRTQGRKFRNANSKRLRRSVPCIKPKSRNGGRLSGLMASRWNKPPYPQRLADFAHMRSPTTSAIALAPGPEQAPCGHAAETSRCHASKETREVKKPEKCQKKRKCNKAESIQSVRAGQNFWTTRVFHGAYVL